MRKMYLWGMLGALLFIGQMASAAIQYSNDFENPSSQTVSTAWPEWVDMSTGGPVAARNGRIEWTGASNHWLRLDKQLPIEYSIEFDFFYQENINGRFSFWPLVDDAQTDVFNRYNYFMRKNTHYFNGGDTIPSEGPRDLTLPLGANAHRMRAEVNGDHILLMYKVRGEGGWVLIDERDFPAFGDGPRYVQLGFNHDGGDTGLIYIDNVVVNYREENLFSYSNAFENPANAAPATAWPEWVDMSTGGPVAARNGRIEWTGASNHWLRLNQQLPKEYYIEFDFFYQENINGRFSFWPLVDDAQTDVFNRYNYFMRKNTHYFNGGDTIPSEGPRDLTLPLGANAHRMRAEVNGDHILLMYKVRGEGGWVLIDERDFPAFGDGPRYVQLGFNHDGGDTGLIYIDNFVVRGLAANRATISRDIQADEFIAATPVPVTLNVAASGSIPVLNITEGLPEGWSVSDISDGGVFSNGNIVWSLKNLSQSVVLTYNALPPRMILQRVAGFSGSFDSGDEAERITGETALAIDLPYLYREAIDFDFSGSPVNGKNYPIEYEYGVRYAQGKDGLPSDVAYARATQETAPAVGTTFNFPAGTDFYQGSPEVVSAHGESYTFAGYRDEGEAWFEKGASDTGAGIGSIDEGDWFRYTFDLGQGNQVLILNFSVNTWHSADTIAGDHAPVDVYVDNKFQGGINASISVANEFLFYSVGPFEVSGGEHSIVFAFPGPVAPLDMGRIEVVRVQGVGQVTRSLTSDGFFQPGIPFKVSLNAEALYGSYKSFIEEDLPVGVTVTDISDGGQVVGDKILWDLPATSTAKTVTYTVTSPSGLKFLFFDGLAETGLPLADRINGDTSVTSQLWLFGETSGTPKTDSFDGTALKAPWEIEYGSDPALQVDYQEGVEISVSGGSLNLNVDSYQDTTKFDEYSGGRRAPMIVRTDVPTGDFRVEVDYQIMETYTWSTFQTGLAIRYNDSADADITNDEYIFGFYEGNIRVELTNIGTKGSFDYQNYLDEIEWMDHVAQGDVQAKIAVTRRSNELIFSVQMPNGSWQLVGAPVVETRQPTRIALFTKIWGDNFVNTQFNNFTLTELNVFTSVFDWALY